MSDNTRINPGAGGDNIATEDIGAYKIPVIKVRIGSLDTDGGDITATNPLPAQLSQSNAVLAANNPIPAQLSQSNAVLSASNPIPSQLSQSGSVLAANNPIPVQLSQGNAVLANNNPIPIKIGDGVNVVGTTQGRNADNQVPSGTAFQLDVSGPTAILNPCSNLNGINSGGYDRQRSTAFDGQPASGLTAGSSQFAIPFSTTINQGAITGGNSPQTITVTSTTNIKIGDYVAVGGTNPENIFVSAVPSGTSITAVFKANHTGNETLSWFHYNVARDAGAGNNIALTGLSASMTYLFNTNANLAELERSAGGELDGASGNGTAIAAEYEWNGNPLANGSVLSGFQFDRARNVNAKGKGSGTISNNPLAANSTTLTLNSAPTTLIPGQKVILDRVGSNPETNYVSATYTVGSTTVPLQIATQFSHAQNSTVEWDQHSVLGPGTNGFLPDGIGIEEEALYDPASQLYYIERSATADAMPAVNIVAENPALFNGTNMDRARSGAAANLSAFSSTGAELTVLPGNWTVVSTPSAATQATATKAAGAAGVRHVCTSVSASFAGTATNAATLVNLRDGVTGTGTILWSQYLSAISNDVRSLNISGLNIVGSAATAMTLEFAAAGASGTLESVTITGYDCV